MAWIQMFNSNSNTAFNIPKFKEWLLSLKDEKRDISKVVYHYDVLGALALCTHLKLRKKDCHAKTCVKTMFISAIIASIGFGRLA